MRKKKLVYFSGSLNMKIFVLKDKNFHFMSPLKHIRFFKVREKKLMYFIFPNLGPLKYIKCEKMTSSTKVHYIVTIQTFGICDKNKNILNSKSN